jgi:hypothetical protein
VNCFVLTEKKIEGKDVKHEDRFIKLLEFETDPNDSDRTNTLSLCG